MKRIIIAIDGYSSCGKSTLAKEVASFLGYRYIDTGAMYRAVALYMIRMQLDFHHPNLIEEALQDLKIAFDFNAETNTQQTILNGENVEQEIRVNPRVASIVSDISALSSVRRFLVKQQMEMGKQKGIVMDGRDIGTVVFPNAELKLFVLADPKIRAQRRLDELIEKGQDTTFEEVFANIEKRDHMDTTRVDSPLVKSPDAIELDNSNLSKKEQFDFVIRCVNQLQQPAGNE